MYLAAENELERLISENTDMNSCSASSNVSIVRKSVPSDCSSTSDDSENESPNKRLALSSVGSSKCEYQLNYIKISII